VLAVGKAVEPGLGNNPGRTCYLACRYPEVHGDLAVFIFGYRVDMLPRDSVVSGRRERRISGKDGSGTIEINAVSCFQGECLFGIGVQVVFKVVIARGVLFQVSVGDISAKNKRGGEIPAVGLHRLLERRVDNDFRRHGVVHKGILSVPVLADAFIVGVGKADAHLVRVSVQGGVACRVRVC